MRFQNGFNKVAIELLVVQFWSEIILVISNQTRAARSFDFEITRMISDQIALQSVQLPLFIPFYLILAISAAGISVLSISYTPKNRLTESCNLGLLCTLIFDIHVTTN